MFDCIRKYLNKPIKNSEFNTELIRFFTEKDNLFLQTENEQELRVLAGAIINEYIMSSNLENKIVLALALITALFESKAENIINKDIIENAQKFLDEKSIELRKINDESEIINTQFEPDIEGIDAQTVPQKLVDITEEISKVIIDINQKLKLLNKKSQILAEESNIHWWIFHGFSNELKIPLKEIDTIRAPIIIANELFNLTDIIPNPISSEEFLKKVIIDNIEEIKKVTIKEVINNLDMSFKQKFLNNFEKTNLGNLCPIMTGCLKSIETGEDKGWTSIFQNATNLKTTKKIDIIKLAHQSYLEQILVRSLN